MSTHMWNVTALSQGQGATAACPWVTGLLAEYLLTTPTLSCTKAEECIQRGVAAYEEFRSLDGQAQEPYCGRQSGWERRDGQLVPIPAHLNTQSSGYYTIDVAVRHMRDTGIMRHRVVVGEEIMGFKLPPGFPSDRMPEPFRNPDYGYHMTLRSGLQKFVNHACSQPDNAMVCAALSTSNHIITIGGIMLPDDCARYFAIESLGSARAPAEIMDTGYDIGLYGYVSNAFMVPNDTPTPIQVEILAAALDEAYRSDNYSDPRIMYSMTMLSLEPIAPGAATPIVPGALALASTKY